MNLKNLNFFDEYPGFYETGTTGAGAKVLNLRFHPLIGKNLDILKDATVLDIASHDGRWSFAALKNGAKKVYGIEGKKELVQNSIENMKKYGIAEERYHFVVGDIFEEISKSSTRIFRSGKQKKFFSWWGPPNIFENFFHQIHKMQKWSWPFLSHPG